MRLDRWFKVNYPDLAFGHLQKILRGGGSAGRRQRAKGDTRIEAGQQIRIPPLGPKSEKPGPEADRPASRESHGEDRSGRDAAPARATGVRRQAGEAGYSRGGEVRSGDAEFPALAHPLRDKDVFVFNKPFGLAVQGGSA